MQVPAPLPEKRPTGHTLAVEELEPAGQKCPALQFPVHAALASPAPLPYVPAGQSVQTPAPPMLNFPAMHTLLVATVEPTGHAYPAEQGPVQFAVVDPSVDP